MRIVEAAIAGVLGLVMLTTASFAAEPNATACRDREVQVRTALDASQQASNRADAVKEQSSGQTYCAHGFYRMGLAHLDQALKLLGVDKG